MRKQFAKCVLAVWGFLPLLVAPPARAQTSAPTPVPRDQLNVLIITVDTTRADYIGSYGSPMIRTPNMDRLAREGVRFVRCQSCSTLTLPSHSTIMTGLYPFRHGASRNGPSRLAGPNLTLAEHLKPLGLVTQAAVASYVLHKRFGLAQGFDKYYDVAAPVSDARIVLAERKGDSVAGDALRILGEVAAQRFFVWLHFYDPHYPYESARHPERASKAAYADEIMFMDTQIGRVLTELDRLNLAQKTLVVLVADHGEGLGQHEETHGFFLYEPTVRIPLLFRCPGWIPAGQQVDELVRTVDIAPTILDLLSAPPLPRTDGTSLLPRMRGEAELPPLPAYAESYEANAEFGLSVLRSLTRGDWKYILAPKPELYNVKDDPDESSNLAAEQPARAAEMREELRLMLADAKRIIDEQPDQPLTAEEAAALEALGYVSSTSQTAFGQFEPIGGNPLDYARYFELSSRATGALAKNDFVEAERLMREQVSALPNAIQAKADLAFAIQRQGRFAEAQKLYEEALRAAPDHVKVRTLYAGLFVASGRFDKALAEFGEVIKREPDNVLALYNMGISAASLGRLGDASGYLQRALQIEPDARIYHALGVIARMQQNLPKALELFKKSVELDPTCVECRRDLRAVRQQLKKKP